MGLAGCPSSFTQETTFLPKQVQKTGRAGNLFNSWLILEREFIHLSIHSLDQFFLIPAYVFITVLGLGDLAVNRPTKLLSHNLHDTKVDLGLNGF